MKSTPLTIEEQYRALDGKVDLAVSGEEAIRADLLIAFPYAYPGQDAEVVFETLEFAAVCPWTGLPDTGKLKVIYVPADRVLELKSFKYYLLTFRSVGIVQEHAGVRILKDLVAVTAPKRMTVVLDYTVRGGIHAVTTVCHSGA